MTTGISAPPIGTMMRKPKSSESPTIAQNAAGGWTMTNHTSAAINSKPRNALSGCWPGKTSGAPVMRDRKSTRLNSSHVEISYAVFCLKKKKKKNIRNFFEQKKKKKNTDK